MKFLNIVVAIALLGSTRTVEAQVKAPVPGEELTVYLMTMGAGDEIFEKFGHTAIWIHDSARQRDVAYNWGLFDFNDKDFVARLARGNMRYSMAGFEMRQMLQWYIDQKRSVWAQHLNLTPAQRLQVQQLAETNALPENRYYTYDYYRNNCSTLPRDIIDKALGGAVKNKTDRIATTASFRFHTLRLLGNDMLAYTGAQFALGHPADNPISQWQEMFLPLKLMEHIRRVSVKDSTGAAQPLVLREFELAHSTRKSDPKTPPNRVAGFAMLGVGMAVVLLILLSLSLTGLRTTTFLLRFLASLFTIIAGAAGVALLLAWGVTDHVFMRANENILQLNPLLLALGLLLPFAFKLQRLRQTVVALSVACACLSVVGFVLQVLPTFNQPNGEIIGFAMPVQIALALVCWSLFPKKAERPPA